MTTDLEFTKMEEGTTMTLNDGTTRTLLGLRWLDDLEETHPQLYKSWIDQGLIEQDQRYLLLVTQIEGDGTNRLIFVKNPYPTSFSSTGLGPSDGNVKPVKSVDTTIECIAPSYDVPDSAVAKMLKEWEEGIK